MDKSDLVGFHIVSHTHRLSKSGGSRVGYHCPDCGCFYAEGNYSIESATHVLGVDAHERKSCCGKERPTPQLFETLEDVRGFLSQLETSCDRKKATLIARRALIVAHFNQEVVRQHKQKTLH